MTNEVPAQIADRTLYEIPTNTEGHSFWLDEHTLEMYNWKGEPTGFYFHRVQQLIPSGTQRMHAFGFPFQSTADKVKNILATELSNSGLTDYKVTVVDRSGPEFRINAFPAFTETGQPAKYLYIDITSKGKSVLLSAGLLASTLLRYPTYRQALISTIDQLKAEFASVE